MTFKYKDGKRVRLSASEEAEHQRLKTRLTEKYAAFDPEARALQDPTAILSALKTKGAITDEDVKAAHRGRPQSARARGNRGA